MQRLDRIGCAQTYMKNTRKKSKPEGFFFYYNSFGAFKKILQAENVQRGR